MRGVRQAGGAEIKAFPLSSRTPFLRAGILALMLAVGAWAAGAAEWTDALGRRVDVPGRPRRIVSLVPSVTEVLFAVGAGDRLVGVTRFCTYPPEARNLPQVGGYADPSLEAIVALSPDLVFGAADSTPPALIRRLEALGIPVYVVYPRSLADTVATIRQVGRVAGVPGGGQAVADHLEATVETVRRAVQGLPRPEVLLCIMVRPLVVAGPGTLGHDLVEAAGGRNVVPPGPSRYPTWGAESLLAADPEVIIVSPHPGEPFPVRFFGRWPELRAVASGRVVPIESDWLHRPGPRLAQGLRALAEALHPGVWGEGGR